MRKQGRKANAGCIRPYRRDRLEAWLLVDYSEKGGVKNEGSHPQRLQPSGQKHDGKVLRTLRSVTLHATYLNILRHVARMDRLSNGTQPRRAETRCSKSTPSKFFELPARRTASRAFILVPIPILFDRLLTIRLCPNRNRMEADRTLVHTEQDPRQRSQPPMVRTVRTLSTGLGSHSAPDTFRRLPSIDNRPQGWARGSNHCLPPSSNPTAFHVIEERSSRKHYSNR